MLRPKRISTSTLQKIFKKPFKQFSRSSSSPSPFCSSFDVCHTSHIQTGTETRIKEEILSGTQSLLPLLLALYWTNENLNFTIRGCHIRSPVQALDSDFGKGFFVRRTSLYNSAMAWRVKKK